MKTVNVQYAHLTALIIDDHSNQRQQLRWHMNQLGIESVEQAGSAREAYENLSRRSFDVVLCDFNLDSNAKGVVSNGQQLLEHARATGVLGPSTIFMMVSGNNSYLDIAATVEQKPDAYLVKPITTKTLEERLQRLLERQVALANITSRQRARNHEGAIEAADQAMVDTPEYTLQALQMKGNSQLELGAFEDAIATFERALGVSAKLDWAHYGKARALKGLQRTDEARAVLETLVDRNRLYASAYELLAAMAEESGNDQEAVQILQRSLEGLPSPRRARSLAEVAYRAGDVETARTQFDSVLKSTKGTFVARTSDVLMLAQSAIDMGDHQDALKLINENAKLLAQDNAHQGVGLALQAQAYAGSGDTAMAKKAADLAKEMFGTPGADFNSLLVAKGLLAVGDSSGLDMLKATIKGDHENARMLSLARKVLKDTGNEAQIGAIVDAAADSVRATLDSSQKLRRSGDFAQAKSMVDQALAELPNNTGVLIEAAQVYLLLLMRQDQKEPAMVTAAAGFLQRLDQLLPGDGRVVAQHAYFRRVMSAPDAEHQRPAIRRSSTVRPELFAAVAHDLKNELGWLETALERTLIEAPERSANLTDMHRHCVKLRRRLVEFLTLYGHETGVVQALAEPCALHGFLQDTASSSIECKTQVDLSKAPAFWVLDDRLVALALAAALDNACKFARHIVCLGAEVRDNRLVLFVEDDGPGLGSGGTPQGTGLGTEVARMVATAHAGPGQRGEVHLFNRPEGGCRFELVLPP